jgi:hypothetical protein
MDALFKGLLETGAPWGILCAVLMFAVGVLWKRCNVLSDRLYELAIAQVRVNTETKRTIQSVEKDVEDISRRFKI